MATRPLARVLVTLAVAAAMLATGCAGSDDPDAATTTSTSEATSTTTAGADRTPDCPDPGDCTLAEAATAADVLIGTAGKWSSQARIDLQAEQFTAITNENEGLWHIVHPAADTYDWTGLDRVVDFAEQHDMDMTLTHFLWDPPSLPEVVPDWVRAIDDPDELRAVMRTHIRALADRYGDKVGRLNVVNEPLDHGGTLEANSLYRRVLGPGYIAEAFAMAREEWPEVELVLNENFVEYSKAKADGLVTLVEHLLADDVPVDGVGLQAHFMLGRPDMDLLADTLQRLGALDVDVALTEIDVPLLNPADTLESQADLAAEAVTACLAVDRCSSITFWGFDDGDTWLDSFMREGTKPLLYDEALHPKPMFTAVRDALLAGRP